MSLSDRQISIIKGMIARGDKQHWISAYFDCNSGRIAEVNTGERGLSIPLAPDEELPPPGPYMVLPMSFSGSFEEIVKEKRRQEELRDGE